MRFAENENALSDTARVCCLLCVCPSCASLHRICYRAQPNKRCKMLSCALKKQRSDFLSCCLSPLPPLRDPTRSLSFLCDTHTRCVCGAHLVCDTCPTCVVEGGWLAFFLRVLCLRPDLLLSVWKCSATPTSHHVLSPHWDVDGCVYRGPRYIGAVRGRIVSPTAMSRAQVSCALCECVVKEKDI